MKKCYIAGKIGDLPKEVYETYFELAKEEVIKSGMIPVSPVDLPHNHGKSWAEYMREDLIALMGCDYVYALRNWRQSPGATIEINIALQVGIDIIHQ